MNLSQDFQYVTRSKKSPISHFSAFVDFRIEHLLGNSINWLCPLVLGGAALAGKVALDRRTAGIQLEDEAIEFRSESGLRGQLPKSAHVRVSSYNRVVLLSGEVSSENERSLAERFVKSQDNVKLVVNDLAVSPESSLTQRAKTKSSLGKCAL